jgi:pimeloyl-ACP methyl ester carboxylesterase
MKTTITTTSGLIDTGPTQLYYEICGRGPTLMLIAGGTGDAGGWSKVVPALGQDFMVVTYDRRGFSRSPRPDGWTITSVMEYADDAAALLRHLDLAPAIVIGHSSGASIACRLVVRHPDVVRHAVIYEAPLLAVVPHGEEVVAGFRGMVEQAMAQGGPRRAMEVFMRTNAGDEAFEHWHRSTDPAVRERVLDNGAVFFPIELPAFATFVPDCAGMRASGVPLTVVVSEENRDTWLGAASAWLVQQTAAKRIELPGGHAGFETHPREFVELVGRVARK